MLWKSMLEEVMADLLLFVDPEIGKQVDLNRGFEFLDKELAQMYPEPEKKSDTKFVDKLVKVYQKDGSEEWVLCHVEVQGKDDPTFAKRMFKYYCRIFDRFDRPMTAIAKLLIKKGFGENKTDAILSFLHNYVRFAKPETNRIFEKELDRITGKTNTMGIIEQVRQMKLDEAREEARKEALQERNHLFVENLLSSTDFSAKKIASLAGVSVAFVNKVKAGLKVK